MTNIQLNKISSEWKSGVHETLCYLYNFSANLNLFPNFKNILIMDERDMFDEIKTIPSKTSSIVNLEERKHMMQVVHARDYKLGQSLM